MLKNFDKQRDKIRKLSKYFRNSLEQNSLSYESPIIPVLIEDPKKTIILRDRLLEKGILVGAVRPPTVPGKTSRLRISLHSGVEKTLVDELLSFLNTWKQNIK